MLFGLRSTLLFCQVLYQVVCFADAFGKSGHSEMSNIVAEAVASTMKDRPKSSHGQYVNVMAGKTHVVKPKTIKLPFGDDRLSRQERGSGV